MSRIPNEEMHRLGGAQWTAGATHRICMVIDVKDLGIIGSWRQEQTIELTRAPYTYRPWPESTAELYKLSDYSRTTSSNASEARRLWADRRKGYQNTVLR
jgi:hypothetical protein